MPFPRDLTQQKDVILSLYDNGTSISELIPIITNLTNKTICAKTIQTWLKKWERKIKPGAEYHCIDLEKYKSDIIEMYVDKKISGEQIAEHFKKLLNRKSFSDDLIFNRLESWGITRRTSLCDRETILSNDHQSIIDGLLLGDGTIEFRGEMQTSRLSFATIHKEYAKHVIESLPFQFSDTALIPRPGKINYIKQPNGKICVAHGKEYFEPRTKADLCFNPLRKLWYPEKIKIVPESIKLTPLAVLHWFYGDGSTTFLTDTKTHLIKNSKVQTYFHTNGFTFEDVHMLIEKFKQIDHRLDFYIHSKRNQPVMRSGKAKTAFALWEYIESIFTMDCFKYKIKKPCGINNLHETTY